MPKKLPRASKETQQKSDRFYIGGSAIGILCGLHPTKGPLDLYNELMGITPPVPQDALMEKGITLEPIAAAIYEKQTGEKLREVAELVHPEFPFIKSHIDREIVSSGNPWEAKCPTSRRFHRWKNSGLPQNLIAQLNLYTGIKNSPMGTWSILNADLWQQANFDIEHDQSSYEIMVEVSVKFWRDHVEKQIPPAPGLVENPVVHFHVKPGPMIRVESPDFLQAMDLLRDAKRQVSQAASLESLAKERVKEALGDEQGKYISSKGKLYWTTQPGRKTFDHKRLATVLPLDREQVIEVLGTVLSKGQLKVVMAALKDCDLDLSQFFRTGESFEQMRAYFSGETEDDDE